MGKDRFKKFLAEGSSRRYSIHDKLNVSDIVGAQVATIQKHKWHLRGANNNLNVRDITQKNILLELTTKPLNP